MALAPDAFSSFDEHGGPMPTKRQQAMTKALRSLAPQIPLADASHVLARAAKGSLKALSPNVSVWLALTSHVRHRHTDYDRLLIEGYDRDAARYFVIEQTERQLTHWGCTRPLLDEPDEDR
jgi:hypothetical protein